MPYVTVEDGVRLYYEEYGSGSHALICMQIDHDRVRDSLERELAKRGFHVYLLTNRGFGRSTHICEDYGLGWYDRFADDVIAFADQMGIDRFVYSGASHGSGVGWHLALRHPERLICVYAVVAGPLSPEEFQTPSEAPIPPILEDPIPFGTLPSDFTIPTDDPRLLARRARNAEVDRALRAQPNYQEVFESPETLAINFGPALAATCTEERLQEVLRTIQVPVLMLGGVDDVCSRPELMLRTAKCLPKCKLIIYSRFGHVVDIYEDLASDCERFYRNLIETGYFYDPVVND